VSENQRLWHGGIPDLKAGDLLLPPSVTGNGRQAKIAADIARRHPGVDLDQVRSDDPSRDWVHFTPHRHIAQAYAASCRRDYGGGALYVVEPVGEVEPDPDFPIQGLRAHAARIVRVYDPHVNLSDDRAAAIFAASTAVERGITVRDQRRNAAALVRNSRDSRPRQTIVVPPGGIQAAREKS
jgi:hypothetical protein